MSERAVSELLGPGEYLVCYDLPRISGLWGVLIAPSLESNEMKYPELAIVASLSTWMDGANLARMRETPLWLDDDPPQGLLPVDTHAHAAIRATGHGASTWRWQAAVAVPLLGQDPGPHDYALH